MRIIAGEYRGRRLEAPSGRDTRPTTDRVREGLMSAVHSALGGFDGLSVLDAFAGSGALGLEALSRGAARCTFLDTSRRARDVIKRNVGTLGLSDDRVAVLSVDAFQLAGRGTVPGSPFDLIFLDPPYARTDHEVLGLVDGLGRKGMLAEGSLVVYEYSLEGGCDCGLLGEGFTLVAQKRYGDTGVSLIAYGRGEDS